MKLTGRLMRTDGNASGVVYADGSVERAVAEAQKRVAEGTFFFTADTQPGRLSLAAVAGRVTRMEVVDGYVVIDAVPAKTVAGDVVAEAARAIAEGGAGPISMSITGVSMGHPVGDNVYEIETIRHGVVRVGADDTVPEDLLVTSVDLEDE